MRSYDKRMLEEINRTVCDHCSDILFVYHEDYKGNLVNEGIVDNVHVVGNTIVEPCLKFRDEIMGVERRKDIILVDIHRPENFNYVNRLKSIIEFAQKCGVKYGLPVKILYFKRLVDILEKNGIGLGNIEMIDLMPFKKYLNMAYHSRFIISDSGSNEELGLFNIPVVIPRDYTERPQIYKHNCAVKYDCGDGEEVFKWLDDYESGRIVGDPGWLGEGRASELIIGGLVEYLG
jgi:UDP-N-acetylglucosamine 2-epimerase (non-hydrolysing)